jgi:beta-lactamase regulating signal transducer with metallopeptidase domain
MSILEFLSQPIWQRLGLTLVHFLWQGLAVAVLIGAFVKAFRLNHGNTRYAVYLLAFVVMIACPIVTFTTIDIPTSPDTEFATEAESTQVVGRISYTALPAGDILPEADISSHVTPRPAATDSIPLSERISDWLHISMPWVLLIWMVGVVILSVRLLMGFIGVYRWRHHLESLPERLAQRIASLSEGLGMRGFSRVFISPSVLQAMAVGYLRPMVLLPAAMITQMQPEMLEAVIAHELAHIRRFDLWVNLAQRVTETLLFYHPAVWWLSNCLRNERELCCDELAIKATGQRLTYASTLESVSRTRFITKQPILATGLGQDNKPTLSRIRHILGLTPTQRNCPFWLAGVIAVLFLAALVIPTTLAFTARVNKQVAGQVEGKEEIKVEKAQRKSVIKAVDNKSILQNGITVELLGLTHIPVKGQPWWNPDGSTLEKPLFERVSNTPSANPYWENLNFFAIAYKLNGEPTSSIRKKWEIDQIEYSQEVKDLPKIMTPFITNTNAYLKDELVKGLNAAMIRLPKPAESVTLRLGIAAGEWPTIASGRHTGFYESGSDTILIGEPESGGPGGIPAGEKGLHIGVVYNITDRDFRVVAIDKNGRTHLSRYAGSGGTDNLRQTTASFPDLTGDELKEYRFQVRPYEWIEFEDISLQPDKQAIALAEQRKNRRRAKLEEWLGDGRTRKIREQILVLRQTYRIHEPSVPQVAAMSAMQELVRMGSRAIPELTAELRRSERWLPKSLIAFVLRAIGDRSAVPALIEVLGKSKYRGEYGIHVKDEQLAQFMLDNQHRPPSDSDRKDKAIIVACPVIEITKALEKITGNSEGPGRFGHTAAEEVKRRWQKWWEENKQKPAVHVEGEED